MKLYLDRARLRECACAQCMHMILTIIAQGFAPRYTWFHQRRRINHLFEVDKKYKRDYNLFFLFGSTITVLFFFIVSC